MNYEILEAPENVMPAKILMTDSKALKELIEYSETTLKGVRYISQSSVMFGGGGRIW